jgi:phosphomannomutase
MSKNKIELTEGLDVDGILEAIAEQHKTEEVSTIDGVKINFVDCWVHLRKSNTEPIIRIYTEAPSQQQADELAEQIIANIKAVANI